MMPNYKKKLFLLLLRCVVLALGCIAFLTGVFIVGQAVEDRTKMKCDQKTHSDFNKMVEIISSELDKAKQPVIDFVNHLKVDTTFNYRDEQQVYVKLKQMLDENPELSGAVMAFEDWVYPQYAGKNGFGALIRRESTGLASFQVGEVRDFRNLNQWYSRQIKGDLTPDWSKPFFSDDSVMISTFSIPIIEDDRFAGSIGVDIDLTPLAERIEAYRPYPSSIVAMINEDLDLLIHPNRSYIGNIRLDEAMVRVGINPKMHPLYHSKDHQGGITYDYFGERRMAFLYIPIPGTRWMCILYCPTNEVYEPVRSIQIIFLIIAAIGFIVIGTFFGIQVHNLMNHYREMTRFKNYEEYSDE